MDGSEYQQFSTPTAADSPPARSLGIDTTTASSTYSYSISGSMGLAKVGSNALVLTASNGYGQRASAAGRCNWARNERQRRLARQSPSINNNARRPGILPAPKRTAGSSAAGTLTKAGGGLLTLTASKIYTGRTTISGGTLQLGNGTGGYDGSRLPEASRTTPPSFTTFMGSETYAGSVTGTGSLTKTGPGCLILSGTNGYTGGTTVGGGTLVATPRLPL